LNGGSKVIFCKDEIRIVTDTAPFVCAKVVLPTHTKEEKESIAKKPYLNKKNITFTITTDNDEYKLFFPDGYSWDGASIPFGFRWLIGSKGDPKFLIPSMVHDKMCECHYLVGNDRNLSSLIFRELLIACGASKLKAQIMYLAVDNFQRTQGWG
jgi:hypothetical protein